MTDVTRDRILESLCSTCGLVAEHFKFEYSADCFCGLRDFNHLNFDQKILDFIYIAVQEKISKETK